MTNPLKTFMDIRREELPLALLMFFYFFLVITSFWILKPIKKTLFITFYKESGFDLFGWNMDGSQAEQLAKVMNMIVAVVAVAVFTCLVRRFRRQQLTYIFSGFFVLAYIIYTFYINRPSHTLVWSFYLFGDLFSTLMVATFFAFLNDSVTPGAAKRMYGLVGLGGVVGGVVGTTTVKGLISRTSNSQWLWICLGIAVLISLVAMGAGAYRRRLVRNGSEDRAEVESKPAEATRKNRGNPALEGAKLVFRSRYLLAVTAIVGLYEICSSIMDFQFTRTIEYFKTGPEIGEHFATVFMITNITSMLVQFFLTSFIMTRLGLSVALLILPLMMLGGSGVFVGFALSSVWVGSFLNTADNGFSYSINQSAKEALYVPTTREEKYKAKAFIDMFVNRFAKSVAVAINLGVTVAFAHFSATRWLSLITIGILMVWIFAARFAGRQFKEMEEGKGKRVVPYHSIREV